MNILFKLCEKISQIVQEIASYTSPGYFKNIIIPFSITITLYAQSLQAREIIIISQTSTDPYNTGIEHYGEFQQRKAERSPFNRHRTLPTRTTHCANTGISLDDLKPYIPEDFFKTNFNTRDIPDDAIQNPDLKHDPIYKKMTTKKRTPSRTRHSTNFYAQYEDDPLPTYTHASPSSASASSSIYTYTPTKEILLLTALCNDWEDSYVYTTQILTQRRTHSTAPSLASARFSW
jgi:hypothetical protein